MVTSKFIALGAFVSLVAAVPMAQQPAAKRDVVWETHTEVAVTTIPVTVTHWLEPGETAPADVAAADVGQGRHYGGHRHGHKHPKPATSAAAPPPVETSAAAPPPPPPSDTYQPPAEPTSTYVPPPPASTTDIAPVASTTEQAAPPAYSTPMQQPPAYTPPAYTPPAETTTAAAQPTGGYGGGSSLTGAAAPGTDYSGDLTYYDPGLGACGITSTSDEPIVAISEDLFDQYDNGNPNNNPLCGKKVTITGENGSPYTATIVDRCTGCAIADLDLSPGFFKEVVPNGDGRVPGMKWAFD